MKKETIFSIITSIIVFIILGAGYEYCVYLWSLQEQTPVIRVDIFIIYPIILLLSILVFFLSKKMNSIIKSIFILLGVIILAVAGAGMYKFNYLSGQDGYDVDGNKIVENQEPQAKVSQNTDEQKKEVPQNTDEQKIIDETMKDIENLQMEIGK